MCEQKQVTPDDAEYEDKLWIGGLLQERCSIHVGSAAIVESGRQKAEEDVTKTEVRNVGVDVLIEQLRTDPAESGSEYCRVNSNPCWPQEGSAVLP